eukprot:tig00021127_g18773.t1
MLLSASNRFSEDIVKKFRNGEEIEAYTFTDFDDVFYRVDVPDRKKEPNLMTISMKMDCFKSLEKYGVRDRLKKIYGSALRPGPERWRLNPFDERSATVEFDVTVELRRDTSPFELDDSIALLKRNVLAAPLRLAFDALMEGRALEHAWISIPWRPEECVWIRPAQPDDERVLVVFSVRFREKDDIAVAKVVLQEFAEVQRSAELRQAPIVKYGDKPPIELVGQLPPKAPSADDCAYVSFSVYRRNLEGAAERREAVATALLGFRNYIHYHLKCTKAYLHSRMRNRFSALLQVLNRARPERGGAERKTAAGKTFQRSFAPNVMQHLEAKAGGLAPAASAPASSTPSWRPRVSAPH